MCTSSTKFFPKLRVTFLNSALISQRRAYCSFSMLEVYPITADPFHTIQPFKNVILRLPSENYKVIDLKPNSYHYAWTLG